MFTPIIHDFLIKLPTKNYDVNISPSTNYGYFEHNTQGDDYGGGLWFSLVDNKMELADFDGMSLLPKEIVTRLREAGYVLDETFD